MASSTEWSPEQLSWLKPAFASIISQSPPFPNVDIVSEKTLLDGLRQHLSMLDANIVIPDTIIKVEEEMPNGQMANIFYRRQSGNKSVDSKHGAVFLIHGGGYVCGTPALMTQTAIALCHDTGLASIVLPYRLAPEAPFPAGILDIRDGFQYVVENAARLSIDASKLALYGQSAGADLGVLAYLAYLKANDQMPSFKAMVLSSPVFPTLADQVQETRVPVRSIDWCWNSMSHESALATYHAGAESSVTIAFPNIHVSQVAISDLTLLPPTHIHIAEIDSLARDGLHLSAKLLEAGVPQSLELRKGDVHIGLDLFIATEAGKASRAKVVEHLKMNVQIEEKLKLEEHAHPTGPLPQFPIDVDASTVTSIVKQYNSLTPHKRLQQVLDLAVGHLHDFVREANLSIDEWMSGILFLTSVGKICSDIRQEFILLSDVLGVSVLVDSLNNIKPKGATPSTVLGPFHTEDAPTLDRGDSMVSQSKLDEGTPMLVRGFVRDMMGNGVADAKIETWETDASGHYDTQYSDRCEADCRGVFHTGSDGAYQFRCIVPVSYPIPSDGPVGQLLGKLKRHVFRPAHLHMMIEADGFPILVTALYSRGDKFLRSDAVLGVKSALVCDLVSVSGADEAKQAGFPGSSGYVLLEWDFVLST